MIFSPHPPALHTKDFVRETGRPIMAKKAKAACTLHYEVQAAFLPSKSVFTLLQSPLRRLFCTIRRPICGCVSCRSRFHTSSPNCTCLPGCRCWRQIGNTGRLCCRLSACPARCNAGCQFVLRLAKFAAAGLFVISARQCVVVRNGFAISVN